MFQTLATIHNKGKLETTKGNSDLASRHFLTRLTEYLTTWDMKKKQSLSRNAIPPYSHIEKSWSKNQSD